MFRPASSADLDRLLSVRAVDPVGIIDADRYRRELDLNQYRFEWSWIHEIDGRIVARALWWGRLDGSFPVSLDCLWVDTSIVDPGSVAGGLVRAGHASFLAQDMGRLPDMNLNLPTDWKEDPRAVAAVDWRTDAVASAGLTARIERLSYVWTPDTPHPIRSTRLVFEPADNEVFLDVFSEVARGSLDIHTQRDVAQMGRDAQAADDLEFYQGLPGDRAMWRLAHSVHGDRVGFIIPSRSAYSASVSYLGVVPEYRGRGFVDDLLAEITIMHADAGAPRITGTTDTTNRPMAAAFHRNGYTVTETRLVVEPNPNATFTRP